jgi:ribosomal protein S18 acetylase RimI-like enzyme
MVVESLVDDALRGAGICRLLMEQVERVARSKSCDAVALSCRHERKCARKFYKRIGYELNSTSKVFLKRLV